MAKLTSGKSLAVLMVFDVPPGIPEGHEESVMTPAISVSCAVIGNLRVTTAKVLVDTPESVAKRFLDLVK